MCLALRQTTHTYASRGAKPVVVTAAGTSQTVKYDCTNNEVDPPGRCRKLPEGNTVAVTPGKITVLSPELFSYHCLV